MSQPVTMRRYYIVSDEHARKIGSGFPEHKLKEVEEVAREDGDMIAVEASSGSGWREVGRYDPREESRA